MSEETTPTQMSALFATIKELELNTETSGLIAIGFESNDDTVNLTAAIQGNRSALTKALAKAIKSDEDLKDLIQTAMVHTILDKLTQD